MDESKRVIGLLKALFAVMVWGASFIATKVVLGEVSAITIVWLRFGMGLLILGGAVFLRKEISPASPKELGYFALLGFIGITFHQWLQSNGLITAQASTTAWIVTTIPIFMAILGSIFLKEHLGMGRLPGIVIAALGVLLVVSRGDLGAITRGSFGTPGDLLVLISAPNWAVFSVLSRRGLQQYPASHMMFYVMMSGWIFTSFLFFAGPGIAEISQLTFHGWLGIGFLGIFCSGLAYVFWYDALKSVPASQVGALLYLEPIAAVVVAAALLHEAITPVTLFGGAIILIGVWIVTRPNR